MQACAKMRGDTMRRIFQVAGALLWAMVAVSSAEARVTRVVIDQRGPAFNG